MLIEIYICTYEHIYTQNIYICFTCLYTLWVSVKENVDMYKKTSGTMNDRDQPQCHIPMPCKGILYF